MIDQILWKIAGFILAVILIFVAPTISLYDRQDAISYTVVNTAVKHLCDGVRDVGTLHEKAYQDFLDEINRTGNTYNVSLEYYEKIYVPIYNEINIFMEDYYISYEGVFTEDIESRLREYGKYDMYEGDLFYIYVENSSQTKSQVIRQIFIGAGRKYPTILVRNGGMIHYEHH